MSDRRPNRPPFISSPSCWAADRIAADAAILLNGLAAMHGRWGENPGLFDFRMALLFNGALLVVATLAFRRLRHDAGEQLSGHRAA